VGELTKHTLIKLAATSKSQNTYDCEDFGTAKTMTHPIQLGPKSVLYNPWYS